MRHFSVFGQQFDPEKDYWKILEMKETSNTTEIKLQYYKMAQRYRLDYTSGQTEAKLEEI